MINIEKYKPINKEEKIDAIIASLQGYKTKVSINKLKISILYEIKKKKIQLYFIEQFEKIKKTIIHIPSIKNQKDLINKDPVVKEINQKIDVLEKKIRETRKFISPIHIKTKEELVIPTINSLDIIKELKKKKEELEDLKNERIKEIVVDKDNLDIFLIKPRKERIKTYKKIKIKKVKTKKKVHSQKKNIQVTKKTDNELIKQPKYPVIDIYQKSA